MLIKNNEYLPFNFDDTILYKEVSKYVRIRFKMTSMYQFVTPNKQELLTYDQVMERYYEGSLKISNLNHSVITITLFDEAYNKQLSEFNSMAYTCGYTDFVYRLGSELVDDIKDNTESNLALFSEFNTYKELFNFSSISISSINQIVDCDKLYKRRCDILLNCLNSKIDYVEKKVKEFYESCGLVLHRFYIMQKQQMRAYHSIFFKNDIIGSNTIVKSGLTYYFTSGKQFKEWLYSDDENYDFHEITENINKEEKKLPPRKDDDINEVKPEKKATTKKTTEKKTTKSSTKKATNSKTSKTKEKEEVKKEPEKKATKTTSKKTTSKKATTKKTSKKEEVKENDPNDFINKPDEERKFLENGDEVLVSLDEKEIVNEERVVPKNLVTAGDKTCYCYFDIKLTEEARKTTIISLSCVSYDGRTFYAEFTDFVKTNNTKKEVIDSLMHPSNIFTGPSWAMTGNREEVALKLVEWFKTITDENSTSPLQMVSDIAHFKFVMLLDLLGDKVPKNMSKCVLDINQDIATSITRYNTKNLPLEEFNKDFVPLVEAYHMDRSAYVNVLTDFKGYADKMDNCLVSATVIKFIHQYMWALNT